MVVGPHIALRILAAIVLSVVTLFVSVDLADAHEAGNAPVAGQAHDTASDDLDTEADCLGGITCHSGGLLLSTPSGASTGHGRTDRISPEAFDLSGITPTGDPPVPIS